jgi:hypothetical protein
MKRFMIVLLAVGASCVTVGTYAQTVDDPFSDYLQHGDTILFGAGNASAANAGIQTITPWPPYVGNTRIQIDGRRSVEAVEQMHRVPSPFARQGVESATGGTGSGASSSSSGNAPSGPVQPVSNGY